METGELSLKNVSIARFTPKTNQPTNQQQQKIKQKKTNKKIK